MGGGRKVGGRWERVPPCPPLIEVNQDNSVLIQGKYNKTYKQETNVKTDALSRRNIICNAIV